MEDFELSNLKPKVIIGSCIIFAFFFSLAAFSYFFCFTPTLEKTIPEQNEENINLKSVVEIDFTRPIKRDALKFEINPEVKGSISFELSAGKHLSRKVIFTPDDYFAPDTDYQIKLSGIENVSGIGKSSAISLSFKTQSVPNIMSLSVKDGQNDFSTTEPIEMALDQKNDQIVDFNLDFTPPVQYKKELNNKKDKYIIRTSSPLSQGTEYRLSIEKNITIFRDNKLVYSGKPEEIMTLKFKTKNPPEINNLTPSGTSVLTDTTKISLKFTEEMNKEDVLGSISINPKIDGDWSWKDNKTIELGVKSELSFGTKYSIKIPKGLHSLKGGFLKEDLNLSFSTIGEVAVSSTSPKDKSSGIRKDSPISVSFDQATDHLSSESHFIVEPKVSGNFSWQGNKMIFKPESLSNNTEYSIAITKGIKSIKGLDSTKDFAFSFWTEESNTILAVKLDLQDKALSCEAASLKMALNFKEIKVSENDIMNAIGFDPTQRSGGIWGDPDEAFVGDINGRQNTTGYGVYAEPIAKAANHWRRAKSFTGGSTKDLAYEIEAGNPVIIWGVKGSSYRDDWHTLNGKAVIGWKGEHARVAIGFRGSPDNPTEFIINDPIAGRFTWPAEKLLSNWATLNYMGVVVY